MRENGDTHEQELRSSERPVGRLLALDLGARRVGVAVSDELRLSVRPLPPLARASWKKLLREIAELCQSFDAKGVVVGLPINLDGSEGEAAQEARRIARNLSLSLNLPVHLQDERLTSRSAEQALRSAGASASEVASRIDGEAAALILNDFLAKG
ncbi:MAG TPA: Holliday junction resolvase RuvX [Pyrinomonadaceae bacterium]|nr:Holliday junction resolvase RuvX [Pyrinomonadaceae bacterium]